MEEEELMRTSNTRPLFVGLLLTAVALFGSRCPGLDGLAWIELRNAGVDKYLGEFTPAVSEEMDEAHLRHRGRERPDLHRGNALFRLHAGG
jgi:hypothetical protein